MPKLFVTALSALVLLGHGEPGRAWGRLGHQVAGDIAEPHLHSTTRVALRKLIGSESLAAASVWADEMRSDPSQYWQETANPYHYVTVPPGRSYGEVGPPGQGDALSALEAFEAVLQDRDSSLAERQLALRFSLHIIQDLHQPLHVGNGRDRGGNDILASYRGDTVNLHHVWDTLIVQHGARSRDSWRARLRQWDLLREPQASDVEPLRWVAESSSLRDRLYPPPHVIDTAYLDRFLPEAQQRLALAGIRSAAWLNQNLGEGASADGGALPDKSKPEPADQAEPEPVPPRSWWQRLLDLVR